MKKILCAAMVIALFSCKKEDKKALTKENLVGTYKQTAETTNGQNTWNTANYDACEMDNTTELKADNTYIYSDAGAVCSPPDSDNGSWSLNDKTLVLDGTSFTVDSFDGSTLVLKYSFTFMGVTENYVTTFKKQ